MKVQGNLLSKLLLFLVYSSTPSPLHDNLCPDITAIKWWFYGSCNHEGENKTSKGGIYYDE